MKKVVAFLRGVNMAGHNKIRMTDLKALFIELGFNDTTTYIQSGNVIFSRPDNLSMDKIILLINKEIARRFGYHVDVIMRTREDLEKTVSLNPFASEKNFDPSKMAVLFLDKAPAEDQVARVSGINYQPDRFYISGREIYLYCPNGFGKTRLSTDFFKNKMKLTGTGRGWRSVNEILRIIEE